MGDRHAEDGASRRTVPLPGWLAAKMADYLTHDHPRAADPSAPLWPGRTNAGGYRDGRSAARSARRQTDLDYSEPVDLSTFSRRILAPALAAVGLPVTKPARQAVTVAVGTALSGGPPHRSQRAELPHWAPRSGPTPVHSSTNRRTRSSTLDAPVPALCPEHVVLTAFPSRCPLPSTISAAAQRPCSTASPVLRGSPTSHDRASRACGLSLPRAARTVPGGRAIVGSPGSRA